MTFTFGKDKTVSNTYTARWAGRARGTHMLLACRRCTANPQRPVPEPGTTVALHSCSITKTISMGSTTTFTLNLGELASLEVGAWVWVGSVWARKLPPQSLALYRQLS